MLTERFLTLIVGIGLNATPPDSAHLGIIIGELVHPDVSIEELRIGAPAVLGKLYSQAPTELPDELALANVLLLRRVLPTIEAGPALTIRVSHENEDHTHKLPP